MRDSRHTDDGLEISVLKSSITHNFEYDLVLVVESDWDIPFPGRGCQEVIGIGLLR